jgi:hypothetical protein
MRVLLLYRDNPNGDSNRIAKRIHFGFVSKLNQLPNTKLFVYGPEVSSPLSTTPYNKKITLADLSKKYTPDVVLLYTISNMHRWLPRDFATSSIPKVSIECDWWYGTDRIKSLLSEQRINLVIQRGYIKDEMKDIPMVWLPFSASEKEFVKNQGVPLKYRKYKIGFIGRGGEQRMRFSGVYQNRYKAVWALKHHGLMILEGRVGHERYPRCVGKYRCCFSDCGRLHSPPAKTFEIMGSGTLLLTDPFHGHKELFGGEKVCMFYKRDRTDLVKVAKSIWTGDVERMQQIVNRGVNIINKKHLDIHRIQELRHILTTYIEKRKVEKIWGN